MGRRDRDVELGVSHSGVDVLMPIQRQAVLDFCRVEFGVDSSVWNGDYLHNQSEFLFRILERWVLVNPSASPVVSRELSNPEAWRWCEKNDRRPPEALRRWYDSLPDATTMAYAVATSEPPWGAWLRAFVLENFTSDSAARSVGLCISKGCNRAEVVEFVFEADLPDDLGESKEKEWIRNALAGAVKNLNKKLAKDRKKIAANGDGFQLSSY